MIGAMPYLTVLTIVLTGLGVLGLLTAQLAAITSGQVGWMIMLVGLPAALAAILWTRWHWAAMACVIYGTVGLALDLATAVQILTKDQPTFVGLFTNGISGLLNFLLILFGGRAFLHSSLRTTLPESRPPSPPSPSSSARP